MTYLIIIALVALAGFWAITGSIWRALTWSVLAWSTLGFWGILIILHP